MTPRLRVHPDARRELDDAVDYYERENPGLGAKFTDEVDAGFARSQASRCRRALVQDPVPVLVEGTDTEVGDEKPQDVLDEDMPGGHMEVVQPRCRSWQLDGQGTLKMMGAVGMLGRSRAVVAVPTQ